MVAGVDDRLGGHDYARRAETALHGTMGDKRVLNSVQSAVALQPFDSRNGFAIPFERRSQAGQHGFALIVIYRAHPAGTGGATFLRAG